MSKSVLEPPLSSGGHRTRRQNPDSLASHAPSRTALERAERLASLKDVADVRGAVAVLRHHADELAAGYPALELLADAAVDRALKPGGGLDGYARRLFNVLSIEPLLTPLIVQAPTAHVTVHLRRGPELQKTICGQEMVGRWRTRKERGCFGGMVLDWQFGRYQKPCRNCKRLVDVELEPEREGKLFATEANHPMLQAAKEPPTYSVLDQAERARLWSAARAGLAEGISDCEQWHLPVAAVEAAMGSELRLITAERLAEKPVSWLLDVFLEAEGAGVQIAARHGSTSQVPRPSAAVFFAALECLSTPIRPLSRNAHVAFHYEDVQRQVIPRLIIGAWPDVPAKLELEQTLRWGQRWRLSLAELAGVTTQT
jgi:hypothetical protein